MVQGPPVFIPFESNAEDEGNKISRSLAKAGKAVGDSFSKAGKEVKDSFSGTRKLAQELASDTIFAEKAARDLVKAYKGFEEVEDALRSGGQGGARFQGLLADAQKAQAAGVQPRFTASGTPIVDKRSVDNAKAVEEQLSLTAQSTRQVRSDTGQAGKNLNKMSTTDAPRLRYAMYDISNSARRIALALGALAIGPIAAAIQYEKDFANVIRTTGVVGDSVDELKLQLREIAQLTPIPWSDITAIATLAGQLGIAETSVADFTETVAKFSATTDLTVDAAATAFGRLDQLIDGVNGNFNNLGSAILAVGVDSVATESQIVNVSTQIASMGNLAGLTAADIVGLSGSLASLVFDQSSLEETLLACSRTSARPWLRAEGISRNTEGLPTARQKSSRRRGAQSPPRSFLISLRGSSARVERRSQRFVK